MDMLNADLFLSNDAQSKKPRAKSTSKKADTDPDQAGFHFIAFVPIGSTVWKLDGLERQPMKLGITNCITKFGFLITDWYF
jgi:ubiquitin carboxyl-terminal hydrolase L5